MPDSPPAGHLEITVLKTRAEHISDLFVDVLASIVRLSWSVINTPMTFKFGLGRALIRSTVSSRSSVPSRAKYDDWIGISKCVHATSALP
jgi:hypothetical protein